MMKKYQIAFVFLGIFFAGIFLWFNRQRIVPGFAGLFNREISENDLKSKIVGLEELLASISRQKFFEYNEDGNSAEIIGYLIGSGGKKVFVDRGIPHQIKAGDWVLAGDRSLFGLVEKTDEKFSIVKTIFDSSFKVAARIVASENSSSTAVYNGIFYFDGKDFVVDFLPKETKTIDGAFVESSGRDGVFRSGFYLGRIVATDWSSEPNLKKAIIEFPLNLGDIYRVKIVKSFLTE